MATCPKGQVYDQKKKECRVATQPHKRQRTITEYSAKEKARAKKRSRTDKSGFGMPGHPMPGEGTKRELKPSEYGARRRAGTKSSQGDQKFITKYLVKKGMARVPKSEVERRREGVGKKKKVKKGGIY